MGHGGGVSEISHHQITSQDRQRLRRQGRFVAIVEWTLVNDNAQYLAFSRNLTHVVLRAIEIANGVDMLFKAVGVRLVVVDVVTWTMGDPIQISDVPDVILNDFRAFSPNLPQIYDSAMLFTGIELNGTTIGIAYTATLCEYLRSSVGVVQDGGAEMDQLISTTAHELGHIFAMIHDTPTCSCSDPTDTCIMEARIGNPPPTTWSSCSVETLQTTLGGVLGMCLYNSPVSTVSDPSCGNGILEQGEQCDCGSDEECTDSCCNSTSCQLIAGAQCKGGPCCLPSCQFRPYGSVCRPNSNECDIEEYCTGDSGDCPRNSFLQNLTPCMGNESFCFSGHCQTRENQCQHHFGAGDAIDACYTRVNTLGNVFGHCGVSETDYLPCSEENAFCGQIQCGGDGELLTTPGIPVRFTLRSESFTCNSVTSRIGEDEVSPGLIRDGTKCGDFMICLNSECVNASVVKGPPCPVGSNGEVCSGQGVSVRLVHGLR
jgi:disintegrin and metalloproteinase domain-containing protein 12